MSLLNSRAFQFVGGSAGDWKIRQQNTLCGDPLAPVDCLSVLSALDNLNPATWVLRGVTSNERYVERSEKDSLMAIQEGLGRKNATYAALIPIRKNSTWWAMTQDERRGVFEAQSRHIAIGMGYLPAIARRLHHCRDLMTAEPFDFLTWFEYAPEHEDRFNSMLDELRVTPEWRFVDREVDIRLERVG